MLFEKIFRRVPYAALQLRIDKGDCAFVKYALAECIFATGKQEMFGLSHCLEAACRAGHTEIVKLLLCDYKVDPSRNTALSLEWAASKGHAAIASMLGK